MIPELSRRLARELQRIDDPQLRFRVSGAIQDAQPLEAYEDLPGWVQDALGRAAE
jgi:hypothetical protein